jgi:hypothetical protein
VENFWTPACAGVTELPRSFTAFAMTFRGHFDEHGEHGEEKSLGSSIQRTSIKNRLNWGGHQKNIPFVSQGSSIFIP